MSEEVATATPNTIPRRWNGWMVVLALAAGLALGTGAGFSIGQTTEAIEPLVQLPTTVERDWLRIVNSCPSPRDVAIYDGEDNSARLLTRVTVPAIDVVTLIGIDAVDAQDDWSITIQSEGGELRAAFRSVRPDDNVVLIGALSCGSEVSG